MTTLAVHTPMPMPTSIAEIQALVDRLCMVEYELAGYKAENAALKAERAQPPQHAALLDSLLADHATNRTALVPAAAPPKPTKPTAPDTNGFDASESESEDEEAPAATERAPIGRAKPKATATAGEAPLQSDAGKKAKQRKRKSAYNMYMASKCAKAKAARAARGEKFTFEDSREVVKGVAAMWKGIAEDRKAFYQARADEANHASGL